MILNALNALSVARRFCSSKLPTQIPHHLGDNVAFAYDLPKHLTQQSIARILDPTSQDVTRVQLILNKLGLRTGKAIIHFKDHSLMQTYTKKYDQEFITLDKGVHKILLRPMARRDKEIQKVDDRFRVRLHGLDYDTNEQQVWKIASDFGEIVRIDIERRPNGLNRGKATVVFKEKKGMMEFVSFADGYEINGRRVKASLETSMKGEKEERKEIQPPRKNMEANYRLYVESLKQKGQI